MHQIDARKIHRVEARWELHKNIVCCLEQILEAALHKTVAVRPLTFVQTERLDKDENLSYILLYTYF